ncbi:MAG: radical SAM protein [Nitrospinae bacterium]|nr:radical SAM protein [Nitrospinota bacterium]
MKLVLISPAETDIYMKHSKSEARSFWFARLSLTMVAALTPKDIDVSIIDENIDNVNFEADVDMVGITVMTAHATRAYEISRKFRDRGVKVVLGGIHPTAVPDEAMQHADAVVAGEAEGIWQDVIEDFKNGSLKRLYRAAKPASLINLPHPRRDLLNIKAYNIGNTVQTTRGCPFSCEFCSVTDFFGRSYRQRPVDEVIKEVELIDRKFVAFVDDNIAGNPKYAKELFRRLAPLKIQWGSQASLTMTKDPELLKLAQESGCRGMFVGIETLSPDNLAQINKTFNKVENYEDAIKKFHDHGISITASIIFGFDNDDEGVFERTIRFLEKNKIDLATFYILTPLPGTVWSKKMEAEGRIIERDWAKYNGGHVLFKPKNISPERLQEGYWWAFHQFYSISSVLKRAFNFEQPNILNTLLLNTGFRRMVKRVIPEGGLSPLSGLLNRLNKTIPTTPTENLIPHAIEIVKDRAHDAMDKIDHFLKVKIRKIEKLQTLLIDLEGVLDKITAKKLRKKILKAVNEGRLDIGLDFKNVSHITPTALNILFDKKIGFVLEKYRIKIRLYNIEASIRGLVVELISGMNMHFEICETTPAIA